MADVQTQHVPGDASGTPYVIVTSGGSFPTAAPADGDANSAVTAMASRLEGWNTATWDLIRAGLTAVQTAATGLLNTLPVGKYNATQPTLVDTNLVSAQSDSRGNLRVVTMNAPQAQDDLNQLLAVQFRTAGGVSTYAPSSFQNLGANTTLNVKASAANVVAASMFNKTGAARYLQLHNTATVPAGAAVPAFTFLVPAGGMLIVGRDFFTEAGVYFSNGVAFACSTTSDTYTAGAATDHTTQVLYF